MSDKTKELECQIKELRIDLRLYYGYTATQVRKMKDSEVIERYKDAIKDIRIGGCKNN
jgi:hypothetical protein